MGKHGFPSPLCSALGSSVALLSLALAMEEVRRNVHQAQVSSFLCLLTWQSEREYYSLRTVLYCYLTCHKRWENSTGEGWKLNLSSAAPVRKSNVGRHLSVWWVNKKSFPACIGLQPSPPPRMGREQALCCLIRGWISSSPHPNLITFTSPHFQIPLTWGLGLQYMNLGGNTGQYITPEKWSYHRSFDKKVFLSSNGLIWIGSRGLRERAL